MQEPEDSVNIKCSPIESNVDLPSKSHNSEKDPSCFRETHESASTARINHEYHQISGNKTHVRLGSDESTTNIIVTNRFNIKKGVINEEAYENVISDSNIDNLSPEENNIKLLSKSISQSMNIFIKEEEKGTNLPSKID